MRWAHRAICTFAAIRCVSVSPLRIQILQKTQPDTPPRVVPGQGHPARDTLVIATCAALGGCQSVPSINVLGAFFPSWMLCAIVGIALTLIVRWVLIAVHADGELGPRVVVYPALAIALGLGTWLLFFRG